ncbi:MAG: ImuA family protein [Planctomycetales bacterium]
MLRTDAREQILQELARRMKQVEVGARPPAAHPSFSTGIPALDGLLRRASVPGSIPAESAPLSNPLGGLVPGTLTEWLAAGSGSGAAWLALRVAVNLQQRVEDEGGAQSLVFIDHRHEFYPPAAAALGLDLGQVLVIRPPRPAEGLWALEQSLRSPAVAATICRVEMPGDRTLRRLQLAAEVGGGVGFLLRPARAAREACWADARLRVQALPAVEGDRRLRLEVLHLRGGIDGGTLELEIDDETGSVRVVSALASATAVLRTARA